jgi:hypothetical protein
VDHVDAARAGAETGYAGGLAGFIVVDEIGYFLAVAVVFDSIDDFASWGSGLAAHDIFRGDELDGQWVAARDVRVTEEGEVFAVL